MGELTDLQRDLLDVIAALEEPDTATLKDELEYFYKRQVHQGQIVPELDRLVRKGLVEKGAKDDHSNCYTLTRQGHHELLAQRRLTDRSTEHRDVWED